MAGLHEALLGGWRLESFVSHNPDTGHLRHPFGQRPSGLILYTTDGHMSAQLTPGQSGEFISYGGRFTVDEAASTVTHHVVISTLPELLLEPQLRHAKIDGERLTLSAGLTSKAGEARQGTLVWRRETGD